MISELQALLQVQDHDEAVRAVEARRDALNPRVAALDKARQRALDEAARAETALGKELDRLHALEGRISEHKERHEKNLEVLNHAHKLKEATAAMSQVEAARRVLADEESELLSMTRRIGELRTASTYAAEAVTSIEEQQVEQRAAIATERASIDGDLAQARSARATSAKDVPTSLLARYDRVNGRRNARVVFALGYGFSCGHCDTAIPLQRRPSMASGSTIATCEDCGSLLYAAVAAAPDQPPA